MGYVPYLLSTKCLEFVDLMGEKTKKAFVNEMLDVKYFSVIADSTLNLFFLVDQLTFFFWFVSKTWIVIECFSTF